MSVLKRVLAVLVMTAALAGCTSMLAPIVGSGRSATEQRSLPAFTELRAGHAIQVNVGVGSPLNVSVTADDNILASVKTTVSGNRLDIGLEGSHTTRTPVVVVITVPSLTALSAHSAGRITGTEFDAQAVTVHTESAGVIELVGRAVSLVVDADSGGVATLGQLNVGDACVTIDSGGQATIYPTGAVTGSVESGGVLVIQGTPASVDVETATAGQVIRQ